ncbi:hypothetical protein MLD38_031703 [Melastoma candidum]|uniref:Uncharacterized protein n=1 Tax=Melastoma candidum TaxID=119954 RepID=A0ACB9MRP6_9MYRT|nr:hypothetical protein MLD38_031703 [Melastoma candidum]
MSAVETSPSPSASTNLRDFLRLKDEDISVHQGRLSGSNLIIDGMSTMQKLRDSPSSHTSRTLLDIIQGEEVNASSSSSSSSNSSSHVNLYSDKDKKGWWFFKEKNRMQIIRSGNPICESSTGSSQLNLPNNLSPVESVQELPTVTGRVSVRGDDDRGGAGERGPASGQRSSTPLGSLVPISLAWNHQPEGAARSDLVVRSEVTRSPNRSTREVPATRVGEPPREPVRCLSAALAEERQMSSWQEPMATIEEAAGGQGSRMSLMDLLEETDRQMGYEFSNYALQEEDKIDEGCGVGEANNCCVCMVRQKGAAFIPCGHTFCRLCSRELWVSRGTCPICNGFILEVLDIF